uniref:RING-type domain-containing protein n=1 Tax=Gouania willdenowi TaxID=441366 RepID=A0A8C5ERG8_GOUWI
MSDVFPGICWSHSSSLGVTAPSAPMTTGTTDVFTLQVFSNSSLSHWYFSSFSCSFFLMLKSLGIDDKEFDIPQVDTPPTLESILSELEDEEEPFVLEDTCMVNTENIDAHSCDTSSLASSDSGDPAFLRRKKRTVDLNATAHGSVLRHTLLKGISAQIVSAATVSGVIAVGTSHGLALVFDTNQALRLCLGTRTTGCEFGAVSALSINHDCSRLLCGFAKGQITMWDLANGKLLRTITDAHPPGTAILHVKFTDDPTLAVCNDSGGSVYELAFRRVMGMRSCDSRCLFSGSKGEVCCIDPLRAPPDLRDHPITQYSLLAMASLTKILVIGLKPSLKVWMTFPYSKSDPSTVPQLSWQFVPVQKASNPVLAFCKGDTVHFLLVKKEESGTIHVIKQRQLQLSCDIISLSWINSRTLVLVDSHEKLQVVDRPSQEVLETLDLEQVQLVYSSRHFKSLATGGNVSQALALVGEKACYQSVSAYGGQIIYLGTKVCCFRIDCFLKQEHFVEALSLAWSVHEGSAKAVVGLFGDPLKRKAVVSDKMLEILFQFAEHTLKKCPEQGKIQVMEQHFQEVLPVLVDYCLLLQRSDLLFSQLYTRLLENTVAKSVFLESLESYIVADRLGHLPPHIMRDLLDHYHSSGMMDSLERCVVHLDVTSLDIHQVCHLHVVQETLVMVYERVKMLITYRIVSCCLAGRAYPLGDIPEDLVVQVKNQVFEFLIRLHSAESSEDEQLFPFIHTLLHFDTREFLNVLAMTFEDFKNDKQALEYQQRIVDILLQVMVDNPDFTPSQVGGLFTFLARQLAKPDNTLFVNRKLFDQVLEFLCCPDDDSRHAERQQVLLELLQVGGVVQFNEERLLTLAEKAEFFQICEFLYEKKHLYDRIIDCYLNDPLRKGGVFSYIHNLLSMPGYSPEEKLRVRHKALLCFTELVTFDPCRSADLLLFHFAEDVQQIISGLHVTQPCVSVRFVFFDCLIQLLKLVSSTHRLSFLSVCVCVCVCVCACVCVCFQLTEKYGCSEASAYLLEIKGDVQGAFGVLLEVIIYLLECLQSNLWSVTSSVCVCMLWFPLLDTMMASQKQVKELRATHTSEVLKELTMKLLNCMSSFISLPAIIQQILQDPVYGKGKLAEIQGLILGMLDTFTYEQTLLETTTSLLNHDLHWSLAHLRAAVTKGLHPRQDVCNICLQQYKRRQDSAEEIIVFSCGHLYHLQCLQQKDGADGFVPQHKHQWRCYKCSSSHGGRGGASSEAKRGRSTSLAQVCVCVCVCVLTGTCSVVVKVFVETTLDPQQEQSWDQIRSLYRGPSRVIDYTPYPALRLPVVFIYITKRVLLVYSF